jgi:serine protease Do
MTGWVGGTVAAAVLGAAGLGVGLGAGTREQIELVPQDVFVEDMKWPRLPEWEEQAVRIMAGSGGRIGVSIRDLADDDMKGAKAATTGVVVDQVETDSPAQKAGFKIGDIVVEFDGERVRSTRQFTRLVQETPVGRPIQAVVVRDGQRMTLNVEPRAGTSFEYFGAMKDFAVKVPPAAVLKGEGFKGLLGSYGRLGITVDDLSPQLAEYFGTKEGVLVTTVNDNSSASKAGLKAGDVITSINGGAVNTAADLRRRAQQLEDGDEITLVVVRDRKTLTLKGKIDQLPARRSRVSAIV